MINNCDIEKKAVVYYTVGYQAEIKKHNAPFIDKFKTAENVHNRPDSRIVYSLNTYYKEALLAVKKNEQARRLLLCINAVLQKKAKQIVVLNVKEISSFTDYLVICSGATDRQVQAISQAIQEYLKKENIRPIGVEGKENAEWILLDYDDVVISVFQEQARSFYGLEDLWDAPRMEIDENATEIKKLTKDMA